MELFTVNLGQGPKPHNDGENGHKLGDFDIGKACADVEIQRVGTHTFDDKTSNTVKDTVKCGVPAQFVVFGASEHKYANQKSKEGANTFVKEGCLIPATASVNPYGIAVKLGKNTTCCVGKFVVHFCDKVTIRLLVGKVAPTTNGLCQKYARQNAIGNDTEILLANFCHHHCCDETHHYATVDAKSATAEIEKGGPIRHATITPREDVHVGTSAKYTQRNYCKGVDCNIVRVVATLFEVQCANKYSQAHTCYNKNCVEVDFKAENVKGWARLRYVQAEIFVTKQKFRK